MIITKEELIEKTAEECSEILQAKLAEFKAEIETIETDEELMDREKDLMNMFDDYQKYIQTVEYELPKDTTFRTQNFSKAKVCEMIVQCLEGIDVEFSYTPSILELCEFWMAKDIEKVSYNVLDATLRFLPARKYRGVAGCKMILTVNEYLTPLHNSYSKDTSYLIYLTEMHNMILDQYKKNHPDENPETDMPMPDSVSVQ
jgi:hypothetical protein